MSDWPQRHDLVELSYTWQDVEEAAAKRHPDLGAALDRAWRVEAVIDTNNFGDPLTAYHLFFDPAGDRPAIRVVRDNHDSLHRLIRDHVNLWDGRYSHEVRVMPPDALQREVEPDDVLECQRLRERTPDVSVEDVPTPPSSGSGVPFTSVDGHMLTPIEVPFYKALRETEATFAVQPWVQGPDAKYRPDFIVFWEGLAVVVELDGHEGHKTREQRTTDTQRQRWFEQRGIRVMRFTGSEVYADVDRCVRDLLDVLRRSQSKF